MKNFKDFATHVDWERARGQAQDAAVHSQAFRLTKQHQQDSENAMFFMAILEQYHEWLHAPGED